METEGTLGTVRVTAGTKVSGRYKRQRRTGKPMSIAVDRCLIVKDSFGNEHPYFAGTLLGDNQAGLVAALRADCFIASTLVVEEDPEYVPLGDGYYVNPDASDPMYGFFEHLEDPEDIAEAVRKGILPAENYETEKFDIPVVVATDDIVEIDLNELEPDQVLDYEVEPLPEMAA